MLDIPIDPKEKKRDVLCDSIVKFMLMDTEELQSTIAKDGMYIYRYHTYAHTHAYICIHIHTCTK